MPRCAKAHGGPCPLGCYLTLGSPSAVITGGHPSDPRALPMGLSPQFPLCCLTLGGLEGTSDVVAVGHASHQHADPLCILGSSQADLEAIQQRIAVEEVQDLMCRGYEATQAPYNEVRNPRNGDLDPLLPWIPPPLIHSL